jgi:hypothetical protein
MNPEKFLKKIPRRNYQPSTTLPSYGTDDAYLCIYTHGRHATAGLELAVLLDDPSYIKHAEAEKKLDWKKPQSSCHQTSCPNR